MQLAHYLGLLHRAEDELASACREIARAHAGDADVFHICTMLAEECDAHAERLGPFATRYGEEEPDEPERLHTELFGGARSGRLGLLRDLHDLYLTGTECDIAWTLIGQAAQGARDEDPCSVVRGCDEEPANRLRRLRTRMKQAAPQVLVVAG